MPTYKPSVPQPTDNLSQSQADLLGNFQTANTVMGIDHYPFDNGTAQAGRHKVVHLVPQTDPVAITGVGQLYSFTAIGDQQLKYVTGNGVIYQGVYAVKGTISLTNVFAPIPNITGAISGQLYLHGVSGTNVSIVTFYNDNMGFSSTTPTTGALQTQWQNGGTSGAVLQAKISINTDYKYTAIFTYTA